MAKKSSTRSKASKGVKETASKSEKDAAQLGADTNTGGQVEQHAAPEPEQQTAQNDVQEDDGKKQPKEPFVVLADHTIFDGEPNMKNDVVRMTQREVNGHRERGIPLRGPIEEKEAKELEGAMIERKKVFAKKK